MCIPYIYIYACIHIHIYIYIHTQKYKNVHVLYLHLTCVYFVRLSQIIAVEFPTTTSSRVLSSLQSGEWDDIGKTPLSIAICRWHNDAAKRLLASKANANVISVCTTKNITASP